MSVKAADVELSWKRCAEWLARCQLLPSTHRLITDPKSSVMDLVTLLRDGVLLCHLLPVLSDGRVNLKSMKDFNSRPLHSQFLCLRNIRLFLAQCQTEFGLTDERLFNASDLFELRNFVSVVDCLSHVSRCPAAAVIGISGFELEPERDHEYYNSHELAAQDVAGEGERARAAKLAEEDPYDVVDNECEKIYDTVVRYSRQVTINNNSVAKTAREMCIKEILDTEKNYVDALKMMLEEFKKPLVNVLSQAEIGEIFYEIEDLRDIHINFYRELTFVVESNSKVKRLHDVFINAKEKFLIYGDYCGHMQTAQKLVEEITKHDTEKSQAIAKCQQTASPNKFKLTHLLAVPMQRVLKYHLLLDTLIKHTKPPDDQDLEGLRRAHDEMTDLGKYINEVKKDLELMASIDEIQGSITDLQMPSNYPKLSDYGRLQKDGELRVAEQIVATKIGYRQLGSKPRYVFLFDKVVMLCKGRAGGDVYGYKDAFQLNQFRLLEQDAGVSSCEEFVGRRSGFSNADKFTFCLVKHDSTRSFIFSAKSELVRQQWIKAVNEALDNNRPAHCTENNFSFEMASFAKPTNCSHCRRLLYGVFFQGYKCTRTMKVVHKSCIADVVKGIAVPSVQTPRPVTRCSFVDSSGSVSNNTSPVQRPAQSTNNVTNSSSNGKLSSQISHDSSNNSSPQPVCPNGPLARVAVAYNGNPAPPPNMLPIKLQEGDTLKLTYADPSQSWWEGRLTANGVSGWFPSNCLAPMPTPRMVKRNSDVTNAGTEDTFLSEHSWYVGQMTREQAAARLAPLPESTFLVRLSVQRNGEFSISMKYKDAAKHMKIERTLGPEGLWYLSGVRYFSSIPELIEFYSQHSLCESFTALENAMFGIPLAEAESGNVSSDSIKRSSQAGVGGLNDRPVLCYATVICNYDSEHDKALSLRQGQRVAILSKTGDNRHWWKGMLDGRVGYVPRDYLQEELQQ